MSKQPKSKSDQDQPVSTETAKPRLGDMPAAAGGVRNAHEAKALDNSIETIKHECNEFMRVSPGALAPPRTMTLAEHANEANARHLLHTLDIESTSEIVAREMAPVPKRFDPGVTQQLIDECRAEIEANKRQIPIGGEKATPLQLRPHPKVAEIEAIMRRRGILPPGFKS